MNESLQLKTSTCLAKCQLPSRVECHSKNGNCRPLVWNMLSDGTAQGAVDLPPRTPPSPSPHPPTQPMIVRHACVVCYLGYGYLLVIIASTKIATPRRSGVQESATCRGCLSKVIALTISIGLVGNDAHIHEYLLLLYFVLGPSVLPAISFNKL